MSAKAMGWALEQTTELPIDKLILIAIANFADEHHQCYPARKTLARMAMCSLDSVDRAMKRLLEAGLVAKAERTGANGKTTSNCYTLPVEEPQSAAHKKLGDASRKMRPAPQPQNAAIPAAPNAAPPAAMVRPHSEPLLEPSLEGVSETHAGHGVFVNCETIRHPAFTISLPAIRMGTQASGLTADEIKTHCVAHALQWAAEIEAGKLSGSVVPSKIANFLSASIMGATNRKAAADNRKRSVFAADDGSAARKRKLLDTASRIAAERDRETAHGRA